MAVDYDNNNKFKALAFILEDYTEWFGHIALFVAYSGEENVPSSFGAPASFTSWLENSDIEIDATIIQPIMDMHSAMISVSADLIQCLKSKQKPKHQDFIEFKNLYSSFLSSIRRLEKDSAMNTDGSDELTGLRPAESVKHDLDKEMQRLSRNGNPFALVIAHIDSFEDYSDQQAIIQIAVRNIKKSMRPFDDAYYLNNGQFLMSLKHADMVGAEAAVRRVQHELNNDKDNINKITISCCMAEPVTGDELKNLLKNMQKDLAEHEGDRETILKFLDVSPLERFIGSNN